MCSDDCDKQIERLQSNLNQLIKDVNKSKKDGWDKLSIISSLISTFLVLIVGGIFTYCYQLIQDERQLQIKHHQTRLQELDCVSKLMPYLTSEDERIQKGSFLTLNILASTEVATELAVLNLSVGSESAVKEIAASQTIPSKDKELAKKALEKIKQRKVPENQKIKLGLTKDARGNTDVKLVWNKSPGKIEGYNLYYGRKSGIYTDMINVGNSTTYTLRLKDKGIYYIVTTAYFDSEESAYSDEMTVEIQ